MTASKEEQCEIELEWFNPKHNQTKSEIEEIEDYHKYCPKSRSSNIISCPKKIIKKRKNMSIKLKWLNDYFKKIAKKSKKTKKFKVRKDKRKKKKKTKSKTRKSRNRKKRKRSKRDKNV